MKYNIRLRYPIAFLGAYACFFLPYYCQAKDWDYERAQYLTDAQVRDLRGPVQSVTTDSGKSEFDRKGNLIRWVGITPPSSCYETTYTNDASGNRLRELTKSGTPKPGDIECQNQRPLDEKTYTYIFNKRGLPTSRTTHFPNVSPNVTITIPDTTAHYSYDSAGRPIKIDYSSGTTVNFYEYSYETDPRGLRVREHSYYSGTGVIFDVTKVLLYAADGMLLEVTQSPPDVFGFRGNAVEVYDSVGRLSQEKGDHVTTYYEQYDTYGNWTVRRVGSTREVRSFTYY